ncbi:hypothetical protein M406DRAFT_351884 [Cryphonectria parasitica EP155]|uniref:DUF3824 domain-containing protein n=1 Tax=Cryphonectria parasitica (strain ATCC 38755 / EP155) TaxID=660469 RepID=A0A9P5CP98_CRYP1|nr:uncharacterized protein M406DRAFT_351884 [Cryphonectria parasitica EP155]KAF3764765.1 hypothetical protein M406DRAFT_351884 [Cryphonectria parasitica EP155]
MSGYDYDPPRRERGGGARQTYYREDYVEPQDPYLRVSNSRDLVPRGREESVEDIPRDFPPPGYQRDVRRARSAGNYDYDDDERSVYTRRSRDDRDYYEDDYYQQRRRPRKAESVYIEEEERKRKRMLSQQEKIIAAVAGAAVALGGKELFDRREAHEEGSDVHRNILSSAALGAAGAFAAYKGAEVYNKRADKTEKKSTHIVHKGRDGKVTEYYSDDEDEKQKKGHKNFLESALAAAGLGGALKALTGSSGGGDKEKDRHGDRDLEGGRDRGRGSDTRSHRGSRSRSPGKGGAGGNKIQKAAMASLIAGATEAFRVSKEPGSWKGEKAKRILTAAAGAATIDAAQKPVCHRWSHWNRMINGSKKEIIEDKDGRSRSRSRARSEGGGKGGMGLAALATAGLGAIGAKKAVDNIREERSRSRRRSVSRDSYDSRDDSPPRRQRSRSRSVVDSARRSLAKIGIGKKDDESEVGSRRGGGRYSDDEYSRDGPRDARYRDDYDDDRLHRTGSRSRGAASRSRASSRSSASSSDLGDSEEDEKRAKKMRGKQIITSGLAAVATIHAAHNVYQSMEKRNARHRAVKAGKLSEEEAKKLKTKALLQDAASVGIAAMGIKGAISEMKEARELSHEVAEFREKKEERHQRRMKRLERQRQKQQNHSDSGYSDYSDDEDDRSSQYRGSRTQSRGPLRNGRYDDGPRYSDGNPYASLPAPPVGYSDRR